MVFDDNTIKRAEAFLAGRMSTKDAHAFKEEIARNPDLKDLLLQLKAEQFVMEVGTEQALRERMQHWKEEAAIEKVQKQKRLKWISLISLFIGCILTFFLVNNFTEPQESTPVELPPKKDSVSPTPHHIPPTFDPPDTTLIIRNESFENPSGPIAGRQTEGPFRRHDEKAQRSQPTSATTERLLAFLATEPLLPPELDIQVRTVTNNLPVHLDQGELDKGRIAFKEATYSNAIQYFSTATETNDSIALLTAQRWLAHSYLANQQYKEASELFSQLAPNQSLLIRDAAEWYWVLSLLPNYSKQIKVVDSLINIMVLPENEHGYAKSAQKLQAVLNDLPEGK